MTSQSSCPPSRQHDRSSSPTASIGPTTDTKARSRTLSAGVSAIDGGAKPLWQERPPDGWPDRFIRPVGCSHSRFSPHAARIRSPVGAPMTVRRKLSLEAGYFRTGTCRVGKRPTRYEETGLAIPIGLFLSDTCFLPVTNAVVQHNVRPSRPTLKYFLRRCRAAGLSKSRLPRSVPRSPCLSTRIYYLSHTVLRSRVCPSHRSTFGRLLKSAASIVGLGAFTFGYATSTASAPPRPADRASPAGCP